MDNKHPGVGKGIRETKSLTEEIENELKAAINEYKQSMGY